MPLRHQRMQRMPGSVSHGTMRDEDLIPTFIDVIRDRFNKEDARRFRARWNRAWTAKCTADKRVDTWKQFIEAIQSGTAVILDGHTISLEQAEDTMVGLKRDRIQAAEDIHNLLDDLFNYLDNRAGYGLFFGAHPGDGSDYGFWPVER